MNIEDKEWIDEASYYQLLERWRFAGSNDLIFQGNTGLYYQEKLYSMRKEISNNQHVKISKIIGW